MYLSIHVFKYTLSVQFSFSKTLTKLLAYEPTHTQKMFLQVYFKSTHTIIFLVLLHSSAYMCIKYKAKAKLNVYLLKKVQK